MIDKHWLQQQVLQRLRQDLQQVEQAAREAHATATHEENIAENKYDTLGLEAAYLATGQARRAEGIRHAIAQWRQFNPARYAADQGIGLGAGVCLVDANGQQQLLFVGPAGGSMQLVCGGVGGGTVVQVLSRQAPLAQAMWGKVEGDAVQLHIAGACQALEVLWVV